MICLLESVREVALGYLTIGMLDSAAMFVPLLSDIFFWFEWRRGIAVALVPFGNYWLTPFGRR